MTRPSNPQVMLVGLLTCAACVGLILLTLWAAPKVSAAMSAIERGM